MPPKKSTEEVPRFGRVGNNLKMGIVGLPNIGKSSLFNLLSESAQADAENYPFCTIDPNTTRCAVPDKRYQSLVDIWKPPSQYPAYLHLVDIAGLIKGASEGAGLGNAFLSHIQSVDGIFHLVRAFDDRAVTHVEDSIDPERDLDTITAELCKKDLAYVIQQRENREKDVKKNPTMKLPPLFFTVMDKVQEMLENNQPLAKGCEWTAPEVDKINELIPGCITLKPTVYLVNCSQKSFVGGGNKYLAKIKDWVESHGGGLVIPFSVEFEEALAALRKAGDVDGEKALLDSLNGRKSVLPRIVKCGYKQLKLMYYFTAGEKEVRCWTLAMKSTAPQAAGVIHSDFEAGFIKLECCSYDDFMECNKGEKSMANVKAAGKYRQEGKNYIVQDGDICHFLFNKAGGGKNMKK
ncbi:MAG: obg-like ATPase 1 [Bacillariaceae sp.]|jgi:obg-like ATPase 1